MLHNDIESYKAAVKQQRYSSRLEGMASGENVAILLSVRERLLNRFGSSYGNQYGWAATALGNANPNFADIEQSVNLDHLRPYYQLASHNVHANPKGVFFSLATNSQGNALLCGPSNAGLADPGHGTAISLAQATINLLTMHLNIDRLVLSKVMLKLTDEIGGMFLAAHDHVKFRTVPQKPIN